MIANTPSRWASRVDQMFPVLDAFEIDRMRRFGSIRHYAERELIAETGKAGPGMIIVIKGQIAVTQHDGLGHISPLIDQGPGGFFGEVGQLSGRASLVDARAEGAVEALVISPERLRSLLVAEADLGERIMRALILRRVALLQSEIGGPLLIGAATNPDVTRLQVFLSRNGQPYHPVDPALDPDAASFIAVSPMNFRDLPWVVCADGSVLHNPTEAELARAIGMVGARPTEMCYDVAVVGAGPAGLATAVYSASEGLSVAVFDAWAFGGQAGSSARIENYVGFPTGISGQALAGRAFVQAQKFGADITIPAEVKSLHCHRADGLFDLKLESGECVIARSVVIATGARYRRPSVPDLHIYEGKGVWYWASPIEAKFCAGEDVIVVGGGNSAAQAAVFLSNASARVLMLVRGGGLSETMSKYLIDRIAAAPNIVLHTRTELVAFEGTAERGLQRVRWRDHSGGIEEEANIRNVFLFIGADPATAWLSGCGVNVDKAGFVKTGGDENPAHNALETSIPGIFAVGDVRCGSIKRVGSAIGEGAQVVAALHAYLSMSHQRDALGRN